VKKETMNKEELRKEFLISTGKTIAEKRKKKNISQKELGEALGHSISTISRYEKGSLDMPISNLPLICNFCGFHLKDYLKGWEKDDLNKAVTTVLSYKHLKPEQAVVKEYIRSCTDEELDDLLEINYCLSSLKDDRYKERISNTVIDTHMRKIKDKEKQFERLYEYYVLLREMGRLGIE